MSYQATFDALSLPSDRPWQAAIERGDEAELRFSLSPELSSLCNLRAHEHNLHPFVLLQAGLRALVLRYEGHLRDVSGWTLASLIESGASFSGRDQENGARFQVGFEGGGEVKADLVLSVRPLSDGDQRFTGAWRYRRDLFDADTIARIDRHYGHLLGALLEHPGRLVSEPSLLSDEERERASVAWNNTRTEYPQDASIPELFEQIVREHASRIAVVEGAHKLTYLELNARANALAGHLAEQGVEPGSRVGLAIERSTAMVVSMVAVLKCGASYVPLDSGYPAERLRFMIADTTPRVIITERQNREKLPPEIPCVFVEDAPAAGERVPAAQGLAGAESTAYIMYTSGSTGTPKGVEVLHRGVIRLVRNATYVDFGPSEVFAQVSNASFDAITFEVWGALLNGGRLVILPTSVVLSPEAFAAAIQQYGVTAMFLTSSLFNFVAARCPYAFHTVRHLLVGGDAVDPRWARHVLHTAPPRRMINGYGPTECTTFAVTYEIREVPAGAVTVPIGRPLSNSQAYVLDHQMRPAPVGVPGELYLGGDGLAKGYWNQPELTTKRFVPSPFDPAGRARLYKTGDLARYRKNGLIECLGRTDHQVKIRGFRIEPGEIETTLRTHPLVTDGVVVMTDNPAGFQSLVAYVATGGDSQLTSQQVRQFLRERLPEFMLPSAIVFLDQLPLSANGKVDRGKLPRFDAPVLVDTKTATPMTPAQQVIALAWKNALGVYRVGLDDNFFDVGGDSLRMAAVECELKAQFQTPFSIVDLFEHPTVRSLARWLTEFSRERNLISEARERAHQQRTGLSGMRSIPRGA